MIDTKDKTAKELYDDFLLAWPIETVKNITIDKYTNLKRDSFTYDIESQMRELGSIKGGSSFKFGIYERENKTKNNNNRGRIYTDDYAWYAKYGNTKKEAFEKVKYYINEVIKYAQNSDLQAIDEKIDLGEVYKWKIAFHYQNQENISIVPVFTYNALKIYLENRGIDTHNKNMPDLYKAISQLCTISNIEKAISLSCEIWDEYIKSSTFNPVEEKENIKTNSKLSKSEKTNATSDLDYIEYMVKAYTAIHKNKHKPLENSFEKFLKSINIEEFKKDKTYIDFQFTLGKEQYICELKPSETQNEIKYAIRDAIGQILGYSYDKEFDYKIIIFQKKPNAENEEFLDYLKNNHNIYYLYEKSEGNFLGNILKN